jgi:predicted nucleic acid-binding protein
MKNNFPDRYVLDAYAVLCYLGDEAGADQVAILLAKAKEESILLYLTWMNLGEVYYRTYRKHGSVEAEKVVSTIKKWPLELLPGDESLTLEAAKVKALHQLSYADAFAIGAALKYNAAVVTGDPEIKAASAKIGFPLFWLEHKLPS